MRRKSSTSTAISVFDFENHVVRVVDLDGEPWFIFQDLCRVLEIQNAREAAARLDDDERGVATADTPGGPQQMTTVNASGAYATIFTSRKPEAQRFRKYVTSVILPTIHKTGSFTLPTAPAVKLPSGAAMNAYRRAGAWALAADPGMPLSNRRAIISQTLQRCGIDVTLDVSVAEEAMMAPPGLLHSPTDVADELGVRVYVLSRDARYKALRKVPGYMHTEAVLGSDGLYHKHPKWTEIGRLAVLDAFRPTGNIMPFNGGGLN